MQNDQQAATQQKHRNDPHFMRARGEVAHVSSRVDTALEPLIAWILQEVLFVEWVAVRIFVVDQEHHTDKKRKHNDAPDRHALMTDKSGHIFDQTHAL